MLWAVVYMCWGFLRVPTLSFGRNWLISSRRGPGSEEILHMSRRAGNVHKGVKVGTEVSRCICTHSL